MNVLKCSDLYWVSLAAEQLAHAIQTAVRKRGVCHLALAGGSTPKSVYEAAVDMPEIPFDHTEFWFSDERCVPAEDPGSNFRMANESLLSKIKPKAVHRMEGEGEPARAAAAYSAMMPERIDVLLLGMGGDGHTASLFPGSPLLTAEPASLPKVAHAKAPVEPHDRLSFCPQVLCDARTVIMLVRGEGKAPALKRALEGPVDISETPAQLVRDALWIIDEAAAAQLEMS